MVVKMPLLLLAGTMLLACQSTAPSARPVTAAAAPVAREPDNVPDQILDAHNRHRAAAGVPPLLWDQKLAADAQSYGPYLARLDRLMHSPKETRPGQGENLWRGTPSAFSVETMVENWADERSMFRAATFPNVSTTNNWRDVAHYTQMIWRSTTHVGCAVHRAAKWDYLICRYTPKGNIDGQ